MTQPEICPKCSAEFNSRKALLSGGVGLRNHAYARRGLAARCPNCLHIFRARQMRLFGVLPPNALRWVIVGLLATCIFILFVQRHGG